MSRPVVSVVIVSYGTRDLTLAAIQSVREQEHQVPLQVVVVDKPPGLTVHPAPGHPRGTLVNALLACYPELEGVGDRLRPGLVHRLDADTSGLMVIARTPLAHESLSRQIKELETTKVYLALVRGQPEPSQGTVEAPIARHPRSRQRMGIVPGGRHASTQYRTLRLVWEFVLGFG